MPHVYAIFAILCLIVRPPLVLAQDDEVQGTPAILDLLLPEGELRMLEMDCYLLATTQGGQMPGGVNTVCQHWQIIVDDQTITFIKDESGLVHDYENDRVVFDRHGIFIESTHSFGQKSVFDITTTARRNEGEIDITRHSVSTVTNRDHSETQSIEYDPDTFVLHAPCLPLALAYHIREEHEDFEIPIGSLVAMTGEATERLTFQAIGTEAIEIADEQYQAHVFIVSNFFESAPDENVWPDTLFYVLPTGQIVRTVTRHEGATMIAETVTAQVVEELLGVEEQEDREEENEKEAGPSHL